MTPLGYNPFNDGIEQEFAHLTGYQLRGVNIHYRGGEVMTIWKAWDDRGKPIVLFVTASTLDQCWEYLAGNYQVKAPYLKFIPDKYCKVDKEGNTL